MPEWLESRLGDRRFDCLKVNKLAQDSAYTVIIARQLKLYSGPNLVLNTDYGDTDIPVPSELKGIAGIGDEIVLAE